MDPPFQKSWIRPCTVNPVVQYYYKYCYVIYMYFMLQLGLIKFNDVLNFCCTFMKVTCAWIFCASYFFVYIMFLRESYILFYKSCNLYRHSFHIKIDLMIKSYMSHNMRFPTRWYVWPAKAQTSLRIHTVRSEPLLVAWIFYEYWATDRISFGVS